MKCDYCNKQLPESYFDIRQYRTIYSPHLCRLCETSPSRLREKAEDEELEREEYLKRSRILHKPWQDLIAE